MADVAQAEAPGRLAHYPVTFFATVMGLAGLTLAVHAAEERLGLAGLSQGLLWATVAAFVAIGLVYVAKALRHPSAVAAEWHHPVKLAFFPAISISLLLIGTAALPLAEGFARPVWLLGLAGQGVLTLAVISGWIGRRPFQPMHVSPAWFIPAVGNILVPVAGVRLGFAELSWLFFSTGLVFWLVLLTLVMNRLIFHDPLPGRLLPTLVILVAPPAVGFLSWLQLTGEAVDPFGRILLNAGYAFALIVAIQVPKFRDLPFALSWWALSFPLAALAIASFRYADLSGSAAHGWVATGLLGLLALVVAGLVLRTLGAILRGEICQPE
jgi:tellurite resistance protein